MKVLTNRGRYQAAFLIVLAASIAPTCASAGMLFSTSYEAPAYTIGALSGQAGWANSFDIDPTVSSLLPRTGIQGLEIRKNPSDNPFGLTFLTGPFTNSQPLVAVEHSIYLPASNGWTGSWFSPMALIGENGYFGQIAIRNGVEATFVGGSTPIQTDTWIDLKLVLDFPNQTQEAFINGVSIGSTAFESVATQLVSVEIFHIFGSTNDSAVYVDDLRITAVPEPSSVVLVAAGGCLIVLKSRKKRRA
jgi:hypothetical protein